MRVLEWLYRHMAWLNLVTFSCNEPKKKALHHTPTVL